VERSTVSGASNRAEHRAGQSIEPDRALLAEPLAERSGVGTATVQRAKRSTVSRTSSRAEHRQPDERSTDSEPSGALSASRTEYRQQTGQRVEAERHQRAEQ
jgi:hypothetical protein